MLKIWYNKIQLMIVTKYKSSNINHFSAFSKIFLERFHPNSVPLTCSSLCILGDLITDGDISNLRISGQSLIKENCHNSRTRNDIDRKFGSVTKNLIWKTKRRQKKLMMTSYQKIVILLSFLQFMVNLEQFRSRVTDVWSVKFMFSLIVILYLTKTKNRTKKSLAQLSHYCLN